MTNTQLQSLIHRNRLPRLLIERKITMLSKKMYDALQKQIRFELESAYLYLGMALKMQTANYKGYCNWLYKQYREELEHAEKMMLYVQDNESVVELHDIKAPAIKLEHPIDVAKAVLAHERKVTANIHDLYRVARAEEDFATESFLQWFVSEQIQEEKAAQDVIDKFVFAGESHAACYAVDRELAMRE